MNTLEKIQWIKEHKYAYPNYEELLSILEKLHQQESRFTKDDLLRLARKIKPVMREDKNKTVGITPIAQGENLFWIPPYPIHSQSFIGGLWQKRNSIRYGKGLVRGFILRGRTVNCR